MSHQPINFINSLEETVNNKTFVKISLGNYNGNEDGLKQLYIKPVLIKKQEMLAFNYRYQTNDIFKNYSIEEALSKIKMYLEDGFQVATLFTTSAEIIYEKLKNGKIRLCEKTIKTEKPALTHDRGKVRLISPDRPYLNALGLTDKEGKVFKNTQDKYKQVNHYIGLLYPLLKGLPPEKLKKVVDMGAGKGYLTFALYDFITHFFKTETKVTGVEYRQDLVAYCNEVAQKSAFYNLSFIEGSIAGYNATETDILIALHACDTATDDAIAKGIEAKAALIVVAPCCHKQIRGEMEKATQKNELSFVTKHGIFLERQAEMLTDAMRALILEYHGYKTKIMQFIADAHTPKNVMIVGTRKAENLTSKAEKAKILQQINEAKTLFGIQQHALEKRLPY